MYKRNIYTVLENKNIAKDVYRMVLEGDTSFITAPGQFINIEIEGYYLRRPIQGFRPRHRKNELDALR